MNKKELIKALEIFQDDDIIVCSDEFGGWDNIYDVYYIEGTASIVFGGGNPFTDE